MEIKIVINEEKYWNFIRKLRNNNEGFSEVVSITPEQQSSYMGHHNDNYFICLVDGKPAGFVGEIDGDIRVATSSSYQNQGIGQFMIEELMKIRPHSFAKVDIENKASLKLFEKCVFKIKYFILKKV